MHVPVTITGHVRYAEDKMLVRVVLTPPDDATQSRETWQRWRDYIASARDQGMYASADLNFQFTDPLGFTLARHDASVREFRRIVDKQGDMVELEQQFEVAIAASLYRDIYGWRIGWNNWPEWKKPAPKPAAKTM